MVDPRHPLVVLTDQLAWAQIEQVLTPHFERKARTPGTVTAQDMLGEHEVEFGGGVGSGGRPRLPVRLMASLLYLKNSFNLSDEELVARWSENVVWQFFSGMEYYEPRLPCDATQIGRFRTAIGEEGLEQLLKFTIQTAVEIKAIEPAQLERVIVDSTVQEGAIAHPVDSRLLEMARYKVVKAAKAAGIALKQTFAAEGKELQRKAGGYAEPGLKACLDGFCLAKGWASGPTRPARPRQAVQALEEGRQAPAHDPRSGDARSAAQAGCPGSGHCRRRCDGG